MGRWKERRRQLGEAAVYLAMGAMLAATGFLAVKGTAAFVMNSRMGEQSGRCIVIDAGHGKTDDRPKKSGLLRDCLK